MKIKVSEATNLTLDWLVAKASQPVYSDAALVAAVRGGYDGIGAYHEPFNPSTNWAQGGPIIERERISIRQWPNVPLVHAYMPQDDAPWASDGTSPLIAAMRAYVTSKLGDEVDVPEELTCSPVPKNV